MSPLNSETVTSIVGRMDDMRVAEIIRTGATESELIEAKRWSMGETRTLGDADPQRPAIVSELVEILRAGDMMEEDDRT